MTDLPTLPDPALFIVVMTILLALGSSSFIAGWAEGRFSFVGLFVTVIAFGGFYWVARQEGFGLETVPLAFIEIVARISR